MTYEIERYDNMSACVVHLSGELDLAVVPELRETFGSLLEAGFHRIVIDLAAVEYADSSALGLLIWLDQQLREPIGRIVLSGANKNITKILELAGLVSVTRTLRLAQSVSEALGGFEDAPRDASELWAKEIVVGADVENLASIREEICSLLDPLDLGEGVLFDIKVALGEALANAVRHGSPDSQGCITVRLRVYRDRLVFEIKDCGQGFDSVRESSKDLYAPTGRGILFMRALMDQVSFTSTPQDGTVVTLEKNFKRASRVT